MASSNAPAVAPAAPGLPSASCAASIGIPIPGPGTGEHETPLPPQDHGPRAWGSGPGCWWLGGQRHPGVTPSSPACARCAPPCASPGPCGAAAAPVPRGCLPGALPWRSPPSPWRSGPVESGRGEAPLGAPPPPSRRSGPVESGRGEAPGKSSARASASPLGPRVKNREVHHLVQRFVPGPVVTHGAQFRTPLLFPASLPRPSRASLARLNELEERAQSAWKRALDPPTTFRTAAPGPPLARVSRLLSFRQSSGLEGSRRWSSARLALDSWSLWLPKAEAVP